MKKLYDILITHADYLAPDITIRKDQTIAIRDGVIAGFEGLPEEAETVLPGAHLLVMPGLTDGHIHTSQQLLKGRLLDTKPVIWKRVNVPFESRLTVETSALSASLAAMEMIRCGTTSFVDAGGKYPEVFADIYEKAGMRGRLSVMTNDNPNAPETLRAPSPKEGVEALRRMKEYLHGLSGRLKPIYSVTTPTAVSEDMLRSAVEAAKEDNVPFETHLNEYASEVTEFIERYGERPFVWLEQEGLIPKQMLAAHSIFLSPSEMEILSRHGIRVVHCPFSNSGKGVPKTPQMLSMGISCCFGSDGAGHGGLDLFREIRLFRCLINVTRGIESADSSVMPAETLLRMATQGGAVSLFEDEKIGVIEKGAKADLIALRTDSAALWPTQNLVHTITESACGADVAHTIIDGRLVMKDRELLTLDEDRIRYEAEKAFKKEPFLINWK